MKTLNTLIGKYKDSLAYENLSDVSRRDYLYFINVCQTTMDFDIKLSKIDTPMAQRNYNAWAKDRGVSTANHVKAVMSRIFNFGREIGECKHNPFTVVKKIPHRSRKEVWTKEQVKAFIQTAYSQFNWRSIGVIVHAAYTWGQRLTDIRNLTFDQYDFNKRVLTLEQSKRRARVYLPTTEELHKVLEKQYEDMKFQKYVAPRIAYEKIIPEPYSKAGLNNIARKIREAAGLPRTLWIMDMRRTATTEMVDAGVPLPQIMSVTGHANAQSLAPYMKHTLLSATEALSKRGEGL